MLTAKSESDTKNTSVEVASLYSRRHRATLLFAAAASVVLIALVDWRTAPYISIGFLYLFPIMIFGGLLSRWQIAIVGAICAVLQEAFSNLPSNEAIARLIMAGVGFIGTGLFVSEILRNRQLALEHVDEVDTQIKLRREAEEQLRVLVESSPAAIVTIDAQGKILLANHAAQRLLAPGSTSIIDESIAEFLPALQTVVSTQKNRAFRTDLQCRGRRKNGEVFLAAVWFSTYTTELGPRLAAIVVDVSENLRDREDLSLDHLLTNARILMGAVAHEIRNLCGAVLVMHKNLSRLECLQENEDFRALGTLIEGLEKLSAMEVRPSAAQRLASVELSSVLDELRVLIEPSFKDAGMEICWELGNDLPLVFGERYGLQQVFLNLARNGQRAMESAAQKRLTIRTTVSDEQVVIRFEDTGSGIAAPYDLFKPFQRGAESSGIGLYVSRAIMRSFGGDVAFEPRAHGCTFAVTLTRVSTADEVSVG